MICIECHDPIIPNEDRLCEKCLEAMLSEHLIADCLLPYDDESGDFYQDMLDNSYPGEYDEDSEDTDDIYSD